MSEVYLRRVAALPNSNAIKECYKDEDGWWVALRDGYVNAAMDNAHTVNGENWQQLIAAMREVKKA